MHDLFKKKAHTILNTPILNQYTIPKTHYYNHNTKNRILQSQHEKHKNKNTTLNNHTTRKHKLTHTILTKHTTRNTIRKHTRLKHTLRKQNTVLQTQYDKPKY